MQGSLGYYNKCSDNCCNCQCKEPPASQQRDPGHYSRYGPAAIVKGAMAHKDEERGEQNPADKQTSYDGMIGNILRWQQPWDSNRMP